MSKHTNSLSSLLLEIVESQGEEVLLEGRLMGLVQDLSAGHFTMTPVLRNAMQARVPQRLSELMEYTDEQRGVYIDNITQAFQDNYMLRPEAATYVVESLAYAMGYLDDEPADMDTMQEEQTAEPTGEPSFLKEDDGEYCGYHRDGQRTGYGILRREDGSTYSGEWRLGMRMGFGLGYSTEHKRYAGQWYMNRQNGIGVEMTEEGMRYVGLWKQGKRDGWGMEVMPNGNSYCRCYQRGRQTEGRGVCLLPGGDIVIGRITEYGPEGSCLRISGDGEPRQEEWRQGHKV